MINSFLLAISKFFLQIKQKNQIKWYQYKKRGKCEVREKFPWCNKSGALYKWLITTERTCPRGEIGRHKGLKTLGIEQD